MDQQMSPHDLQTILQGLSADDIALKHGDPSKIFAKLNNCIVGAVRFSGQPPWERHPDGDELLHVIEGDLEVTLLAPEGRVRVEVRAGSVFIVPRGLWHRSRTHGVVSMLFATPTKGGEVSFAEDPSRGS